MVPGSDISIFDHKGANVSVQVAIALAFLWLVPDAGGRFRLHLTALATVVLLVGATQGRSGFVAAAAGLAAGCLLRHGGGRLAFAMGATVLLIIVAGWGLNVRIEGDQGRTISVDQLGAEPRERRRRGTTRRHPATSTPTCDSATASGRRRSAR